jgi:hypothetical protein
MPGAAGLEALSLLAFAGTKVQILTPEEELLQATSSLRTCRQCLLFSVYLLYWYKSTHTDAEELLQATTSLRASCRQCLLYSVYLLYWYKRTHTDAEELLQATTSRRTSCRQCLHSLPRGHTPYTSSVLVHRALSC